MSAISEIELNGNQILLDDALVTQMHTWGHRLKGYIDGNQLVIVPAGETPDPHHPLISRYDEIADGEPVIAGTRVTVRAIVEYDRLYHDLEHTLRAVPHLTREQAEDALGYYADHRAEIDAYIASNALAYDEGANAK